MKTSHWASVKTTDPFFFTCRPRTAWRRAPSRQKPLSQSPKPSFRQPYVAITVSVRRSAVATSIPFLLSLGVSTGTLHPLWIAAGCLGGGTRPAREPDGRWPTNVQIGDNQDRYASNPDTIIHTPTKAATDYQICSPGRWHPVTVASDWGSDHSAASARSARSRAVIRVASTMSLVVSTASLHAATPQVTTPAALATNSLALR